METEFVKIITKHQGIIHKVCRLYCLNEFDAEDLFQEIVLQLWKSYPRFNNKSLVSTWMYKVALNTSINRLRKVKNRNNFETLSFNHLNISSEEGNVKETENEAAMYLAITKLDKFDKALVVLYLEDKNYREISEILGISENYVGVKMNRIKKRLKEILNA